MGGTSSTTRPKTDRRFASEQLCCDTCSHHNPGQLCRPTLHRPGTSTTAVSPRLEKNQNGRRQNAVRPRPGPTAGSRQRRPARRCRRLSMPRRRPTRLGQAGRRTLPALRPRCRHRSPRRHRIGPPHGGQNDGRTERQLHPAGQRRLPNMATR